MEKYAKDIKIGDTVNRYCQGWQTVTNIRKSYLIYITFSNGEEIYFNPSDKLFVV